MGILLPVVSCSEGLSPHYPVQVLPRKACCVLLFPMIIYCILMSDEPSDPLDPLQQVFVIAHKNSKAVFESIFLKNNLSGPLICVKGKLGRTQLPRKGTLQNQSPRRLKSPDRGSVNNQGQTETILQVSAMIKYITLSCFLPQILSDFSITQVL